MKLSPTHSLTALVLGAALFIAPAANAETRTFSAGHQFSGFYDGGVNKLHKQRRANFALKRGSSYRNDGAAQRASAHRFDLRRGSRFDPGGQ